uniref:Uncharacterized protein n=1 Tax=Zonotrichia albicollis TaxID=44394 RepID=A0A8D2MZG3_ZONAL
DTSTSCSSPLSSFRASLLHPTGCRTSLHPTGFRASLLHPTGCRTSLLHPTGCRTIPAASNRLQNHPCCIQQAAEPSLLHPPGCRTSLTGTQ